jgi:ribosomal protein L11 methyltransferase
MDLTVDTQGLHPASALCFEALQWLHAREQFSNILEIGCGNGVLSLTAASIWDADVIAGDIAPQAVEDTLRNIEAQQIANVRVVRSDGFNHPLIAAHKPYDLIICNLLAELLVSLGNDIKKHLKSDGYIIFSGILAWKAAETMEIYQNLGFEIVEHLSDSPWNCYILRNKAIYQIS